MKKEVKIKQMTKNTEEGRNEEKQKEGSKRGG